jgi:alkanesulfonate monooxygenase SsuD/methylene tetrahydromethanopterin reductase-like flavin-dependent oxidoreductase (luciferase family)
VNSSRRWQRSKTGAWPVDRAAGAQQLDDAFIDRFAIAGTPERVQTRLEELRACGIDRVIVVSGSLDSDSHAVNRSCERFAREIIAG